MKNNILRSLLVLLGATLFFASCEKEPEWEKQDPTKVGDQVRTVLVEEYTGQNCPNCPQAGKMLHEISKQHPKNVIVVAMHSKHSGKTRPQLESEDAKEYADKYSIPTTIPGVMINRKAIDGTNRYSTKRDSWNGIINEFLKEKASIRLQLDASRKERKVELAVSATLLEGATAPSDNLELTVWVVEDIKAPQQEGGTLHPDYLHHNVLRMEVEDDEDIKLGEKKTFSIDLSEKVVDPENAKLVVFISDDKTEEVYETALVALGKGIGNEGGGGNPGGGTTVEKVSFLIDGKEIDPEKEIEDDKSHMSNKLSDTGDVEGLDLVSPFITVKFPEKMYGYTVKAEVEVMDHKDSNYSGLTSVCFGLCAMADYAKKFVTEPTLIKKEDNESGAYSIQLHMGVKHAAPQSDTYRAKFKLKVAETKGEGAELDYEEVAELVFAFTPPKPKEYPYPSNVLILDFTGQKCNACPRAFAMLEEWRKDMKDNLIVVALHSSNQFTKDAHFLAPEADAYARHIGVRNFPQLHLDNRKTFTVQNRIETDMALKAQPLVKPTFSAQAYADGSLEVNYQAVATDGSATLAKHPNLKLLFWVIENDVKGYQAGLEQSEYMHQHIFRGVAHEEGVKMQDYVWGKSYTLGEKYNNFLILPKKDIIVRGNSQVIAILLDADSKEFINSTLVDLY